MIKYIRIKITGTLTSCSNLHIGTGEEKTNSKEENTSYNAASLDSKHNPYIPASTLRGYLRNIISEQTGEKNRDKIFGLSRQRSDADETGNSGIIRVYDALWDQAQGSYKPKIISQTSIDPQTNTAKEHHLYSHEIVPPNSIFKLNIEADNITSKQVLCILKALDTLSKDYGGKLGKSKNNGQGELIWKHKKLQGLTQKEFIKWLNIQHEKPLSSFYQDDVAVPLIGPETEPFINPQKQSISYLLKAESPILINDKEHCKAVAEQRKKEELFEPDLLFSQNNDTAIISGSTIKGWVKARCRKIILTLIKNHNPNAQASPDNIISQIFGDTQQQGLITFDSASVTIKPNEIHQQTFNAIDRFTGGVVDTALYQAESIWPQQAFEARIHYDANLKGWMKLLLLFVLRDAAQGDLVLGWGKSRGYGQLNLISNDYPNWQSLYDKLDTDDLKTWQQELTDLIKSQIETSQDSEAEEQGAAA